MLHAEVRDEARRKALLEWSVPAVLLAITLGVLGRHMWHSTSPSGNAPALRGGASSEPADTLHAAASNSQPVDDGKRYQVPVTGSQPALGKKTALVTLVLWGDLDAADQRVQPALDNLMKRYGDDLRVVFRHLLPQQNAALLPLHELARVAHEQGGKFWELRAKLIHDARTQAPSRAELEQYAKAIGLDWQAASTALDQHTYQRHVVADGIFGAQFGVHDETAIFVNGRRFMGEPSAARLGRLIDQELPIAKAKVAAGVLPENVYWELTKDALWRVE